MNREELETAWFKTAYKGRNFSDLYVSAESCIYEIQKKYKGRWEMGPETYEESDSTTISYETHAGDHEYPEGYYEDWQDGYREDLFSDDLELTHASYKELMSEFEKLIRNRFTSEERKYIEINIGDTGKGRVFWRIKVKHSVPQKPASQPQKIEQSTKAPSKHSNWWNTQQDVIASRIKSGLRGKDHFNDNTAPSDAYLDFGIDLAVAPKALVWNARHIESKWSKRTPLDPAWRSENEKKIKAKQCWTFISITIGANRSGKVIASLSCDYDGWDNPLNELFCPSMVGLYNKWHDTEIEVTDAKGAIKAALSLYNGFKKDWLSAIKRLYANPKKHPNYKGPR